MTALPGSPSRSQGGREVAEYRTAALRKLDRLERLNASPADTAKAGSQASMLDDILGIALASDEARLAAEQALGQVSREARELRHGIRNLVTVLASASTLLRRRADAMGNDDLLKIGDMLQAARLRGERLCGADAPDPATVAEVAPEQHPLPLAQLVLALPHATGKPAWNEGSVPNPAWPGLEMPDPTAGARGPAAAEAEDAVALRLEVGSSLDGPEFVFAPTGQGRPV